MQRDGQTWLGRVEDDSDLEDDSQKKLKKKKKRERLQQDGDAEGSEERERRGREERGVNTPADEAKRHDLMEDPVRKMHSPRALLVPKSEP